MKKILASLAFKIIAAIMAIGAIGVTAYAIVGNFSSGIRLMNTPTVVKEIKKIAELTTATYVDDVVINDTIVKTRNVSTVNMSSSVLKGEFTKSKKVEDKVHFVEIATCTVRVGFDLSKVQDGDVAVTDSALVITLPKAEILDIIMNPSDIKPFYDEKTGEWNDQELHAAKTECHNKVLETVRQRAVDNGIIELAEKTGKAKVAAMFKGFGFSNVTVNIRQ